MTEPLVDTWRPRELPVLRALVLELDQDPRRGVSAEELALRMPNQDNILWDNDTVGRALVRLTQAQYVTAVQTPSATGSAGLPLRITGVTEKALRATGAWPSADLVADRLLDALQDIADHGDDAVTRSRARKALEALGGFTREVLVSVAGAAAGAAVT